MTTGDIVRYSKPIDDVERAFFFVVVDGPHDGRVSIQWLNSGMRLPPIETVAVDEVTPFPDASGGKVATDGGNNGENWMFRTPERADGGQDQDKRKG